MAYAHDHNDEDATDETASSGSALGRDEGREDGDGTLSRTYYVTMFSAVLFVLAMLAILVQ